MINTINDMEEEIWKDVVGIKGYMVSNIGRVKSLPMILKTPTTSYMRGEKILKQQLCKGYLRVRVGYKVFFTHVLVAKSFIGEKNKGMTVNHKDECKTNNCVDNLEYLSIKENIRYGTGIKRSALSRIDNPLICTPVNKYSIDGKFIERYISINKAKELNGYKRENISLCCCHKRNQSNGFIWRYDGDLDVSYNKKTNARPVVQLSTEDDLIREYKSMEEALLLTGINKPDICYCCKGKINTAGGYKWKYKEDCHE